MCLLYSSIAYFLCFFVSHHYLLSRTWTLMALCLAKEQISYFFCFIKIVGELLE